MTQDAKLLPLVTVQGIQYLVDAENRQFRDFDDPENVIKMHSPAGRQMVRDMQGTDCNCMGISTGRQDGLEA